MRLVGRKSSSPRIPRRPGPGLDLFSKEYPDRPKILRLVGAWRFPSDRRARQQFVASHRRATILPANLAGAPNIPTRVLFVSAEEDERLLSLRSIERVRKAATRVARLYEFGDVLNGNPRRLDNHGWNQVLWSSIWARNVLGLTESAKRLEAEGRWRELRAQRIEAEWLTLKLRTRDSKDVPRLRVLSERRLAGLMERNRARAEEIDGNRALILREAARLLQGPPPAHRAGHRRRWTNASLANAIEVALRKKAPKGLPRGLTSRSIRRQLPKLLKK